MNHLRITSVHFFLFIFFFVSIRYNNTFITCCCCCSAVFIHSFSRVSVTPNLRNVFFCFNRRLWLIDCGLEAELRLIGRDKKSRPSITFECAPFNASLLWINVALLWNVGSSERWRAHDRQVYTVLYTASVSLYSKPDRRRRVQARSVHVLTEYGYANSIYHWISDARRLETFKLSHPQGFVTLH